MGLIQKFKEWRTSRAKKNEKWHIIDNFSELPIGKYLQIIRIGESNVSDVDKSTAILQVLTGWSAEDIESLSLPEYSALVSGCSWLLERPQKVELDKYYIVGDFKLKITEAKDLTTAQYIDFQQFAQDADRHILELLSVLLVPVGKRYGEGYDVGAVRKWIEHLPTDVAFSLMAFFLNNAAQSLQCFLISLAEDILAAPAKTEEQMKTKAKAKELLALFQENGGGN